ncbi:MAG: hypothetical protein H6619_02895 [Deltaproteobacteria bacterium]|nr:hypothetical protein [Deltaproteobacteria bacterium]
MNRLRVLNKLRSSREESGAGYVIFFFLIGFLLLFVYGMMTIKSAEVLTTRTRLNNAIISALNAASNVGPAQADMVQVACQHLGLDFNIPLANCPTTNFSWNDIGFKNNDHICDIKVTYTDEVINAVTIKGAELCIELDNCRAQFNFTNLLSTTPYIGGAEGCAVKKPPVAMVGVDFSSPSYRIFDYEIPPTHFAHSDAGGALTSVQDQLLEDRGLPMLYESYLPGIPPAFLGAGPPPDPSYITPFATKEITMGVNGNGVPTQDVVISTLVPSDKATAYLQSYPDVVPQTISHLQSSSYAGTIPPDPMQYIPRMDGGPFTRAWASTIPAQYKYRHGVMTQTELAYRCFGPHKLWTQRVAQQFMYMLERDQVPFGAFTYSNWIIPLMPLISYEDRYSGGMPAAFAGDERTTLKLPTLGPSPGAFQGSLTGKDYILQEFGNTDLLPVDTTDPSTYEDYQQLTRQAAFDRLLQPMSICAREMSLDIRPDALPGPDVQIFTALPNFYDLTTSVAPSTQCADPTKHQIPTLDRNLLNFIFRSSPSWAPVTNNSLDSANPPKDFPASVNIRSGDCFGDQRSNTVAVLNDNKDSLWPNPNPLSPTSGPFNSPCYEPPFTDGKMPAWMDRDRINATPNPFVAGCSTTGLPTGECYNRDEVTTNYITDPYRICPDVTTPGAMENTLDATNLNVASAMSTIRAGGFSKSGYGILDTTDDSNLVTGARSLYLGSVESSNVYPKREYTTTDSLSSGALLNMYNVFSNTTFVPEPEKVKRVAVIFTNGLIELSLYQVLRDTFHGAWFPPPPTPDVLSVNAGALADNPDPVPFFRSIKETVQMAHRMVDEGIEVVVVLDDYPLNSTDENKKKVLIDGLKPPLASVTPDANTYRYAMCKDCTTFGLACNTPLDGEPNFTVVNPDLCINEPIREGITLVHITKKYAGLGNETYSQYKDRLFKRVTIELNRVINRFDISK